MGRTVLLLPALANLVLLNTLHACVIVAEYKRGDLYYSLADASVEKVLQASETLMGKVGPPIAACPTYGERNRP